MAAILSELMHPATYLLGHTSTVIPSLQVSIPVSCRPRVGKKWDDWWLD